MYHNNKDNQDGFGPRVQYARGVQCVGDFNTLEQATKFHNFLRTILSLDLPPLPLN
jgi:hypothetical protein